MQNRLQAVELTDLQCQLQSPIRFPQPEQERTAPACSLIRLLALHLLDLPPYGSSSSLPSQGF
ncbi:unnamed protein product [Linum tenue]|uniref:Uncharacterized protein n=1 Tax=Linum tenue TaxID=586396 RepID=A0AAV0HDW4_9ROSI|nr:unnamed protein product [Linum tenue]